jgi:hypothetical protein
MIIFAAGSTSAGVRRVDIATCVISGCLANKMSFSAGEHCDINILSPGGNYLHIREVSKLVDLNTHVYAVKGLQIGAGKELSK